MDIRRVTEKLGTRRTIIVSASVAVLFIILWIFISFTCAFFACFFLVCLVWDIEAKYPIIISLALLCLCPIILALNQKGAGNLIAMWAYLFFATGVFLIFLKLLRNTQAETDK